MSPKRRSGNGWGIRYLEQTSFLWWKPEGKGYTDDIAQAGLFSEEQASEFNGPRYEGVLAPRDQAIAPLEMLRMVQAEVRKTEARLGNLTALARRLDEVVHG